MSRIFLDDSVDGVGLFFGWPDSWSPAIGIFGPREGGLARQLEGTAVRNGIVDEGAFGPREVAAVLPCQ